MIDPRTPVLVGAGQVSDHRPPEDVPAPADLWAEAARRAEADSGGRLLARVDAIASVALGTVAYPDPGRAVARRLGIDPRRTMLAATGGNTPQLLVNELAAAIARGDLDVALVGGAECLDAKARRRDAGIPPWPVDDDPACAEPIGEERFGASDHEVAHGLAAPIHVYPLLETAHRAAASRSVATHQRFVSELWSTFAAAASTNPYAWDPRPLTAPEIRTPGPDNRLVCFPYTKRMCARIRVDQAATVILAAYGTARDAGVPSDRMVFLHAGADAHDHWFVSERPALHRSPAIAEIGRAACAAAGIAVDDVARFDLYSCFPAAVQTALDALGLAGPGGGDDRPLTVTGGLAFAGGPLNNYVTHSIATMAARCRDDPGSFGLTTALGWYSTKHSVGIWSTEPPAAGYRRVDPRGTQTAVEATARLAVAGPHTGTVRVEATAVVMDRDGAPERGIVMARTADDRRVVARVTDADVLQAMTEEPWEGRSVPCTTDGALNTVTGP